MVRLVGVFKTSPVQAFSIRWAHYPEFAIRPGNDSAGLNSSAAIRSCQVDGIKFCWAVA